MRHLLVGSVGAMLGLYMVGAAAETVTGTITKLILTDDTRMIPLETGDRFNVGDDVALQNLMPGDRVQVDVMALHGEELAREVAPLPDANGADAAALAPAETPNRTITGTIARLVLADGYRQIVLENGEFFDVPDDVAVERLMPGEAVTVEYTLRYGRDQVIDMEARR